MKTKTTIEYRLDMGELKQAVHDWLATRKGPQCTPGLTTKLVLNSDGATLFDEFDHDPEDAVSRREP